MIDPDPVIHAPARLRIVATLATLGDGDTLRFPKLQELLDLTSGNLATHLRRLEDAGYVESRTSGRGRGSTTAVGLTPQGRQAFAEYRAALLSVLDPGSA